MALVAEYKLSGSVWTDTSGNGYNLSNTGTISSVTGFTGIANTAAGNNGTASNYLSIASAPALSGLAAFTVCARVKTASLSAIQVPIVLSSVTATNLHFAMLISASTGTIQFRRSTNGTSWANILTSSTGLTVNTYSAIILEYDGSTMSIYIDNATTANASVASTGNNYSGNALVTLLANADGTSPANGAIDDIQIFNHALSQTERASYLALGNDLQATTTVNNNIIVDDVIVSSVAQLISYVNSSIVVDDVIVSNQIQILVPTAITGLIAVDDVSSSGLISIPQSLSISIAVDDVTLSSIVIQQTIFEDITWVAFAGDNGLTCSLDVYHKPDYVQVVTAQSMSDSSIPLLYKTTINTSLFNGEYLFWIKCTSAQYGKPLAFCQTYLNGLKKDGGLSVADIQTLNSLQNYILSIPTNPLLSSDSRINNLPSAILAAAAATPIAADVKKMNGSTVNGTGIGSDKWRGA